MILFDIEPLQNEGYKRRGIGNYVRNLLSAARAVNIEFAVTYNPHLPPPDVSRLLVSERFIPATRANFLRARFDWLVTTSPFEVSLGATQRLFRETFPAAKVATIVYDLIPMLFEEYYLTDPLERARYKIGVDTMLQSDALLCISQSTADDVNAMLEPDCPVVTIGAGVAELFFSNEDRTPDAGRWQDLSDVVPVLLGQQFIFTVSGGHKSKNLSSLLQAYADCPYEFRILHPLVIGGGFDQESRNHFQSEWKSLIAARRTRVSNIHILPHLRDEDIRQLYRSCALFVYASLYEGFGLPLAEAIVSGAVAISSNRSSLPEILSISEFQFNPRSPAEITALLMSTVSNPELRQKFEAWSKEARSSFHWEHVGERLKTCIGHQQTSGTQSVSPSSEIALRDKIAIIGSVRPEEGGIASYNSEILPHVSSEFDWFSSKGFCSIRKGGASSMPLSLYDESWSRYSERIYVVGNSGHHIPAVNRLNKIPGYVWLHDVRLSGLAWSIALESKEDPWAKINQWLRQYPGRHRPMHLYQELDECVYSFAKPLLQNAKGFIVHSEHARQLLLEDWGGAGFAPPIMVIPHAVPTLGIANRRPDSAPRGPIRIGTLGYIHPIRAPETIIEAAGILAATGQPVTLVLLGNVSSEYLAALNRLAKREGITIEPRGYLEDAEFIQEISQLDVVIQIRNRTNGESSGTVANAIAAGVPTITNIPSVFEFWGEYVWKADASPTPHQLAKLVGACLSNAHLDDHESRLRSLMTFSYKNVAAMLENAIRTGKDAVVR